MGNNEFTIAPGGGTVDPGEYGTDPRILKLIGLVSEANLWLGQVGNNLQVTELGTASRLTVDNFFSGSTFLSDIAIRRDDDVHPGYRRASLGHG
jgi:hypothetical protein